MLFSLPDDTIPGIIGYAFDFFDNIKVYLFLAMGVGLGLTIVSIIYDLFFGYEAEVRKEARIRIGKRLEEAEEEEFDEDVEREISHIALDED